MQSNVSIIYSLAEENFILTAPQEIHSKLKPFLNRPKCKEFSKILIDIELHLINIDKIKDLFCSIKDKLINCKICRLEVAQYYYDNVNTIYIFGVNYIGIFNSDYQKMKWYITDSKIPSRNAFHIFVLDVLSIILPSVNKIVFHGASLKHKNEVIAILGRSGNGKSTITRKLNECSCYTKNSDDTFIVSVEDQIKLYPINSGEGYDPDIAKTLLERDINFTLLTDVGGIHKNYIVNNNFDDSPSVLKSIYILDRQTNPQSAIYTNICSQNSTKLFMHILNSQTNILTPYLRKKLALYKEIADSIHGNLVNFNFECDIEMLMKDIEC